MSKREQARHDGEREAVVVVEDGKEWETGYVGAKEEFRGLGTVGDSVCSPGNVSPFLPFCDIATALSGRGIPPFGCRPSIEGGNGSCDGSNSGSHVGDIG